MKMLAGYQWPGNVRELKDAIEHAIRISPNGVLSANFLPSDIRGIEEDSISLDEPLSIEEYEKRVIEKTLGKNNGDLKATARKLHLSTSTLHRRIKKYHISVKQR